jgi:23S rRNA (cytosine1962-C5)-methyltransferase
VLVVKLYSLIWLPHLEAILQSLAETSGCTVIVLRLSRQLQKSDNFGFHDGQVLLGQLAHEDVEFEEYGVRFKANVIKGHKTGFFLDHRENRHKVGLLAAGKTLLDVFSYAGGFAVHALAHGATEATCLDISRQALELAQQNAALNPHTGRLTTIAGDAFAVFDDLVAHGKQYDLVVIDPPSFAKSNDEVRVALKKYAQLAEAGRALTRSGGVLVLASCSSRVTADDFFGTVEPVLGISEGRFTVIEKTYHAVDHPVGFPEGAYLKCGYYRKVR